MNIVLILGNGFSIDFISKIENDIFCCCEIKSDEKDKCNAVFVVQGMMRKKTGEYYGGHPNTQ